MRKKLNYLYHKLIGNDMNAIGKLENWTDHHHPEWIDFFRIVLGLFLIIKGIAFVNNSNLLEAMILTTQSQFIYFIYSVYTTIVLLVGGLLITFGLITRVVALFELPILIVEIFFVNFPNVFSAVNHKLYLSIITLLLLLFFMIYGSGPLSSDNLLRKTKGKFE